MVIIDTSVVYKWFDNAEENRDIAMLILKKHLLKQDEIVVPDILLYEIGNVWSTKSSYQIVNIKNNLKKLKDYSLTVTPIDFNIITKAVEFAKNHTTSVYDATYAVLASEIKCNFITSDRKFINQTNQAYIKHLEEYK